MDDDGLVKEYQGYYQNQPRLIEKHLPTAPQNPREKKVNQYLDKLNFVERKPMRIEKQPVLSTNKAFY